MKLFNQVPGLRPKKNKFNLSHERKMSLQMGKLVPIMLQEILPGDSFKVNSEILMRFSPLISPVMHRINVYTHYFFVPNRIVWNEWEDFITGGKDGTSMPVHPHILLSADNYQNFSSKTLADYFGLPAITDSTPVGQKINSLPFRAYQMIYNEYYRDQNLSTEVEFSKASGQESIQNENLITSMRNRAWEKDYFTSALPWTQRGPEVTLPIDVVVDSVRLKNGATISAGDNIQITADNVDTTTSQLMYPDQIGTDQPAELFGEQSTSTINDLRRSVRLQEWLERNARGGARYIEQLLSHWGAAPNDARLQRPEFLGGGVNPAIISEVLSTFDNSANGLPQGQMAGHGIVVGSNNGFTRKFTEHGFVIGIMSVIPKTAYQQGIHKMWTREDKLEYAWPEFAQLGEQEIKAKEIFFDGSTANDETFGYTPRYSEYKYGVSTVHGEFRDSLEFWHLGRKFASKPVLNENFITCQTDETKRIFAVTDTATDDLYAQIYHNVSALRALPYYGVPTL